MALLIIIIILMLEIQVPISLKFLRETIKRIVIVGYFNDIRFIKLVETSCSLLFVYYTKDKINKNSCAPTFSLRGIGPFKERTLVLTVGAFVEFPSSIHRRLGR